MTNLDLFSSAQRLSTSFNEQHSNQLMMLQQLQTTTTTTTVSHHVRGGGAVGGGGGSPLVNRQRTSSIRKQTRPRTPKTPKRAVFSDLSNNIESSHYSMSPKVVRKLSNDSSSTQSSLSPSLYSSSSNKPASLTTMASRLMNHLKVEPGKEFDIRNISNDLNINVRRLYDLIHVFEGLGLVNRYDRSKIKWIGFSQVENRVSPNKKSQESQMDKMVSDHETSQNREITNVRMMDDELQFQFDDMIQTEHHQNMPPNDLIQIHLENDHGRIFNFDEEIANYY